MNYKTTIFIILIIVTSSLTAQNSILSSGGDINTNSVSYSIGQIFTNTNTNTNNFSISGNQQPQEVSKLSILEITKPVANIKIYPNPTNNHVTLSFSENFKNSSYKLTDITGRLLVKKTTINQNNTNIVFNDYPSGIYLIQIKTKDNSISTYKILKN